MANILKVNAPKKYKYDTPTFYIVSQNMVVAHMMRVYGYNQVHRINEAAVVIWTGGPDIHPMLYGQSLNKLTRPNFVRDKQDIAALREIEQEQALVGICRGAQFLNVMVGNGSLYQDVDHHATGKMHLAYDVYDKTQLSVTSTHHQMMIPGVNGDVLLTARESYKFFGESDRTPVKFFRGITDLYDGPPVDIEAMCYWSYATENNVLCYQPHPEYMASSKCDNNTKKFFNYLETYCLSKHLTDIVEEQRGQRLPGFLRKRDKLHEQTMQGVQS